MARERPQASLVRADLAVPVARLAVQVAHLAVRAAAVEVREAVVAVAEAAVVAAAVAALELVRAVVFQAELHIAVARVQALVLSFDLLGGGPAVQSIPADVLPSAVDPVGLVAVLTVLLGEARAGLEVPDAREIGALAPMVPTVAVQVAAVRGPSEIPRAGRSADE